MPDPGDELESRVSRLEDEVTRLKDGVSVSRSDAAAARVLAGGADRDVSEMRTSLRAHTQALNALRETQLEQQGGIRALRETQLEQQGEIKALRSEMQQGFGMLGTGMAQLVALLSDPHRKDDESG